MRRAFVGDFGPLAAFCPPIVRQRRRWDVGGGGLGSLLKHLQTVCGGDKPIRRIRGAPHVISGLVRAAEPPVFLSGGHRQHLLVGLRVLGTLTPYVEMVKYDNISKATGLP